MSRLNTAPDPLSFQGADARKHPLRIALWCLYEGIVKDGYLFKNRDAGLGADLLKGWCDLYTYGQAYGFEFLTFDQVTDWDKVDAIILCDRPLPGNPLVETAMRSAARKYLITAECPIIYPPSWDKDYHQLFHRVWTWDDSLVDGVHYLKSNTVVDPTLAFDFETLKSEFANRKLATLIAGAKASQHPQELYSHRIRTIQWFEATAPEDFDLYGMGWDKNQFPSYQGAVADKLETLSKYRFCICYENAQGYSGYITEKIIDCLRSGTVPVYGGAPNVARWIPEDCFIAVNQFSSYFEMFEHLKNMDAATHAGYLDRMARFVTGPDFYPFSVACMVEGFTKTLHWDLCKKGPKNSLVQNSKTMRMESIESTQPPSALVWMTYDPAQLQHQKMRGLWHFFSCHYPEVQFFFVRYAQELSRGEILDNGYDILVGRDSDISTAIHDLLLRRFPEPFVLMHTSLFGIFDPQALLNMSPSMDQDTHWKGTHVSVMGRAAVDSLKRHRHGGAMLSPAAASPMEWAAEREISTTQVDGPWDFWQRAQLLLPP